MEATKRLDLIKAINEGKNKYDCESFGKDIYEDVLYQYYDIEKPIVIEIRIIAGRHWVKFYTNKSRQNKGCLFVSKALLIQKKIKNLSDSSQFVRVLGRYRDDMYMMSGKNQKYVTSIHKCNCESNKGTPYTLTINDVNTCKHQLALARFLGASNMSELAKMR